MIYIVACDFVLFCFVFIYLVELMLLVQSFKQADNPTKYSCQDCYERRTGSSLTEKVNKMNANLYYSYKLFIVQMTFGCFLVWYGMVRYMVCYRDSRLTTT